MSARMSGMVFERYPSGGGELILALALADHAWDDGTRIFPSVKTLAKKTRQSERAVQYQLKAMIASGWLQIVKKASGRPGYCNEYRINPDWITGAEIAPLVRDNVEMFHGTSGEIPPPEDESSTDSYPQTGADISPVTGSEIAPLSGETGANSDETGAKLLHPTHHKNHHKENVVVVDIIGAREEHASYPQFSMPEAWTPSADFIAGLPLLGVPQNRYNIAALLEFTSYWRSRPDVQNNQAGWEHKLMQRLQRVQSVIDSKFVEPSVLDEAERFGSVVSMAGSASP